jgi:hypothetical protein
MQVVLKKKNFCLKFKIFNNIKKATKDICRNTRTNLTNGNELVCQKDEVIKINDAFFGIKDLAICSVRLEGEGFNPSIICDESLETTRIMIF